MTMKLRSLSREVHGRTKDPLRYLHAVRSISTVVDAEVNKFNAVADDWWNPTSTSGVGPLHQLNPCRVRYIRSHVIRHFKGNEMDAFPLKSYRLADIGCGGGILSESLCRLGGSVVAIDPGASNINAAKHHAQRNPITSTIDYRQTTSEELCKAGEEFDIVCSLEVIEHVSDPKEYIASLVPLVKPGGLLFLSTLNRTMISKIFAIGVAEYLLGIVPPGTHEWDKFIQPEELTEMIREKNMKLENISGIVGDPITKRWKIHPNCTAINYILCASKPDETKN